MKIYSAAAAKSLQSCPTLCDPIDASPPGSPIPGILQARTLEWVAISSSNAWKWKVKVKSLSRVRLLETPWTAAYQAPPSMAFSRQEYWSGVPLPSPFGNYRWCIWTGSIKPYLDRLIGEEGERTCEQMGKDLATSLFWLTLICMSADLLTRSCWCRAFIFLRYNIVPLFLLKNSKYEVILHF